MFLAVAVRSLAGLGVLWNAVAPGVWKREEMMAKEGPLSVVRAVVVRIDPARVQFSLDTATRDFGLRGAWTVDSLRRDAVVGVNAGQFIGGSPWGWIVKDGAELQGPGTGSLGMAFMVDSAGRASLVMPDGLARVKGAARQAFQSYPALLSGHRVPAALQAPGRGVDLDHRDSRLAIGVLDDGSVVLAITRFTGLGRHGETMPWGPTVPEMAAFMQSLGARDAMLLDGGISSQLAVRDAQGRVERWPNWRPVPLALIATPRASR